MISKKELMIRLCEAENNIEWLFRQNESLEERIKKLEPKKVRKVKNEVKK